MGERAGRSRVWEIDFLRGIALLLMTTFHVVFDLRDLYNFPIQYTSGGFFYVGRSSAILFMLLAGISSSFSRSNAKRGIKIFAIAMAITVVTYLFDPGLIIKFGILHFFGVSMIIYPLFRNMNKYWMAAAATIIILLGSFLSGITVPYDYLFPIGLTSSSFMSSDYYPLLPWFGVFLYGAALSKFLYNEKRSLFSFSIPDNPISFIGRHSLLIYVIHQPIILVILNFAMK